ncbi:MAG: hypothetical protein HY840_07515 [Bacteroidetes bacterium]|nr:hypothetical protein [Bacteroidota bacterium]
MISIGIELPSPPISAKELRQWRKWRDGMNMLMDATQRKQKTVKTRYEDLWALPLLKQGTTLRSSPKPCEGRSKKKKKGNRKQTLHR